MEVDARNRRVAIASVTDAESTWRTLVAELDTLSNSVRDLIAAREFESAEAVCRDLQERFPDQVDGVWRLAMVLEARGDHIGAARKYREAAAFMRSRDAYDEESITEFLESAERLEAEQTHGGQRLPGRGHE